MYKPTTLVVMDFDYTLYKSPLPPTPSTAWWMSPRSLQGIGLPGFDQRWILSTVQAARKASMDMSVQTALLTGRAAVPPMKKVLLSALTRAGLEFNLVSLKPVRFPPLPQGPYKAAMVRKWLLERPWVEKVVLYDDEAGVHEAVRAVVTQMGRYYEGYKMDDPPSELAGLL